jgi:hypothetical protein
VEEEDNAVRPNLKKGGHDGDKTHTTFQLRRLSGKIQRC